MSDDPRYVALARRWDGMRRSGVLSPVGDAYARGYRHGMAHTTGTPAGAGVDEEIAALRAAAEDPSDRLRHARGCGYLDGLQWAEGGAQGLVRVAVAESGYSGRQWAEDVAWRGERTVRRWVNGNGPVPEVVREQLIETVLMRAEVEALPDPNVEPDHRSRSRVDRIA